MQSTQPDQDGFEARNRPCLGEASVDCRETRLAHCDGFARVFPPGGGLSGPNYQLLRGFHDHHQHQQANPTVMVIQQWSKQSFHPHHPGGVSPPLGFFFFYKYFGKMLNFSVEKRDYSLTS